MSLNILFSIISSPQRHFIIYQKIKFINEAIERINNGVILNLLIFSRIKFYKK